MQKTFTKSDLKSGMIVVLRSEQKCVVIKQEDDFLLLGREIALQSHAYNDELNHNHIESLDVMKIYEYPLSKVFKRFINSKDNQDYLIYKRDNVDWNEVTVDTRIVVSNDGENWFKRRFSRFEDKTIYAFIDGGDSWSSNGMDESWEFAKLAEVKEKIAIKSLPAIEEAKDIQEECRDIEGFSRYMISKDGKVYRKAYVVNSTTGPRAYEKKEMALQYPSRWRPVVSLVSDENKKTNRSVAYLLAKAFIPNPDNKKYVMVTDKKSFPSVTNVVWTDREHHLTTWHKNHRQAG